MFSQIDNPLYNDTLAIKYGADIYGMKAYTLVILKTGSNNTQDKEFLNKCFSGHFSNMERMEKEGKLILAGPLSKNDAQYRGIFIIQNTDKEQVIIDLEKDMSISEKVLSYELYQWFGSAALPAYLPDSEKIWKNKP
ncbi:MAG: hypothetical protein HYU67_02075 [Flavobacteriia bacterium]|nr:hypothetical protein [Flavobacteriia bacterium]